MQVAVGVNAIETGFMPVMLAKQVSRKSSKAVARQRREAYCLEKNIFKKQKRKYVDIRNRWEIFNEVDVCAVEPAKTRTGMGAMEFNVADVRKPLASAAAVVKAKNRIMLDEGGVVRGEQG